MEKVLPNITSRSWLLPLLLVVILGTIYTLTLLPGPGYHGDTGKFQFVGYMLGTPHETGYPTYLILNFLFTHLVPIGSIALRANLLSALFSVAASFVVWRILLLLGFNRLLAFSTALTFGLTPTLWSQSVIAEVYSLNALFVALVIFFFIRWHLQRSRRDFFIGCAIYAVSFGNHLMMIVLLPALAVFVWQTDRSVFTNWKTLAGVAGLIVFGALQYSYLFWRYYASETSYLEMATPDIQTLLWYVSGGRFHGRLFAYAPNWIFFIRIPLFAKLFLREYVILLPVALFGMLQVRNKSLNIFLLLILAANISLSIVYSIPDIFVYLIPSYLILAVYTAFGLDAILAFISKRTQRIGPGWTLLFPVLFALLNYGAADQSDRHAHADETRALLRTVGSDALVICPDYHYAMFLWYYTYCDEWKGKNIQIAFYHEEAFPADAIGRYVRHGEPFYVPVTRSFPPAGLTPYYFSEGFEEEKDDLSDEELTRLENLRAAHAATVELYTSMLESAGLDLVPRGPHLYELRPADRDAHNESDSVNRDK